MLNLRCHISARCRASCARMATSIRSRLSRSSALIRPSDFLIGTASTFGAEASAGGREDGPPMAEAFDMPFGWTAAGSLGARVVVGPDPLLSAVAGRDTLAGTAWTDSFASLFPTAAGIFRRG